MQRVGDPPFWCVWGDPDTGKTVDMTLAFPDGYTLALPGALKSTRAILGPELYDYVLRNTATAEDLWQVIAFLRQIVSGQIPPKPVKLDDITLQSDRTLQVLREQYPASRARQMWGAYDDIVQEVRRLGRLAGIPVLSTAHKRSAGTDEFGNTVKGGPEVGGKRALGRFTAAVDGCYQSIKDPDAWPWQGRYVRRRADLQMVYKDRNDALDGVGPQNLRELFRTAGDAAPRFGGLEWMDTVADDVAAMCEQGTDRQTVFQTVASQLRDQGVFSGWIYWSIRDGLDRFEISQSGTMLDRMLAQASEPASPSEPAPGGPLGLLTPAS